MNGTGGWVAPCVYTFAERSGQQLNHAGWRAMTTSRFRYRRSTGDLTLEGSRPREGQFGISHSTGEGVWSKTQSDGLVVQYTVQIYSCIFHLVHKSLNGLIWSLLISQGDSESVPYHSG